MELASGGPPWNSRVVVLRRPPKGFSNWSQYYQYRVARAEAMGLSRSQARGHPKKGEVPASKVEKSVQILGVDGPVEVTAIGTKERSRAARYDNDVQKLLSGKLTPATFDRRWHGKTIGRVSLPSWRQVLSIAQQGLASFDTFYPSRTP